MEKQLKRARVRIEGMTCHSCELIIGERWKKIDGIDRVDVSQQYGRADIVYSRTPRLVDLSDALVDLPYSVSYWDEKRIPGTTAEQKNTARDYAEIGGVVLIVVSLYLIGQRLHIIPQIGISDSMGYGLVFIIGLLAATSTCLAVTGGLLLSLGARQAQVHPALSGWQKFRPVLFFNVGRIAGYTALGAMVGALGSAFNLSPQTNAFITIAASVVMIGFGLKMLNIFPGLSRFMPRVPHVLGSRIHRLSDSHHPGISAVMGALTFFLPCGFTQSLQLYVLAKGDPLIGALTMLFFSLGTAPALLSLGAVSSFIKGAMQRHFLRFAGVIVMILGATNIVNGLALSGFSFPEPKQGETTRSNDSAVSIKEGKQIIRMKANGFGYDPDRFTLTAGVPTRWVIDGEDIGGCISVLQAPALGIQKRLVRGENVIEFTPQKKGRVTFSCSMGMYRGTMTIL